MTALGTRIKTLRLTAGFTQQELADKLGMSVTAVNNWERGRLPHARAIPKLARTLWVEASELATLWMSDSLGKEVKK